MLHAETIVTSYRKRAAYRKGWAAWAKEFQAENLMLIEAMKLAGVSDVE